MFVRCNSGTFKLASAHEASIRRMSVTHFGDRTENIHIFRKFYIHAGRSYGTRSANVINVKRSCDTK